MHLNIRFCGSLLQRGLEHAGVRRDDTVSYNHLRAGVVAEYQGAASLQLALGPQVGQAVQPPGVKRHPGRVPGHQPRPAHRHAGGGDLQWVAEGASQEPSNMPSVLRHLLVLQQISVDKEGQAGSDTKDPHLPQHPGDEPGPEAQDPILIENTSSPTIQACCEPSRELVLSTHKLCHRADSQHLERLGHHHAGDLASNLSQGDLDESLFSLLHGQGILFLLLKLWFWGIHLIELVPSQVLHCKGEHLGRDPPPHAQQPVPPPDVSAVLEN